MDMKTTPFGLLKKIASDYGYPDVAAFFLQTVMTNLKSMPEDVRLQILNGIANACIDGSFSDGKAMDLVTDDGDWYQWLTTEKRDAINLLRTTSTRKH